MCTVVMLAFPMVLSAQEEARQVDENMVSQPQAASSDAIAPMAPSIAADVATNAGSENVPSVNSPGTEKNDDNLISVNFENVDIRDVIRILADKGHVNMIVGPDVAATVNIQLNNISWEKALDVILMTYSLTYKKDGDLIRIMTLDQLQVEDEKVPLATKIIKLNFARGGEVKSNFEKMLSARGRIDVVERTNSLIITDLPDNIARIEEIAVELDTRTPQVMIEALLADVVVSQDDQLGINWDIAWPDGGAPQRTIEQDFGSLGAPGGIITFGTTMLTDKDLHATIAAWQRQSKVNILAHPQIMTLDNLAAKISLTEEIPYQQQTDSTEGGSVVSTSFKESGINLTVMPHITTKDNYIYLTIDVKQSFRSGFTADDQPIVDSRSAQTNLLVKNRETAVIGGLRKKNDTFTVNKLPILGDIPLIGSAFRKRVEALSDIDLMIFVTPTIVTDVNLTDKQENTLELFEEETEDWAHQFDQVKQKKREGTAEPKSATIGAKEDAEPDLFYLKPPALLNEGR